MKTDSKTGKAPGADVRGTARRRAAEFRSWLAGALRTALTIALATAAVGGLVLGGAAIVSAAVVPSGLVLILAAWVGGVAVVLALPFAVVRVVVWALERTEA